MPGSQIMPDTVSTRVLVETVDGVTVASFADSDLTSEPVIEEVSKQLDSLAEGLGPSPVVLNFREVRMMSSTMLAVLLKFARKAEAAEAPLKLCCIAPNLLEVFRITKFDRLFEIHDEESSALDSF
jgi:anti-sigma B factor antagonist